MAPPYAPFDFMIDLKCDRTIEYTLLDFESFNLWLPQAGVAMDRHYRTSRKWEAAGGGLGIGPHENITGKRDFQFTVA